LPKPTLAEPQANMSARVGGYACPVFGREGAAHDKRVKFVDQANKAVEEMFDSIRRRKSNPRSSR